jgi:uncharacterized protein YodC (DUF2158 family)
MRFKSGDIVIKKTGGNKMTISQIYLNESIAHYKCYWFVENSLFEELFQEDQLVTLDEYKSILKVEERDDKINQILKS